MSHCAAAVHIESPHMVERDTVPDPVCRIGAVPAPENDDEPDTLVDWPAPAAATPPEVSSGAPDLSPEEVGSQFTPSVRCNEDELWKLGAADALPAIVAEYRFRRLQGHQAGCQCQSRRCRDVTLTVGSSQSTARTTEHLGCIDLRARLLAAGLWDVLYDKMSTPGGQGRVP
jgi:hypothetical protein